MANRPKHFVEMDEVQFNAATEFYSRRGETLEDVVASLLVDDMAELAGEERRELTNPYRSKPFWERT
jgi:hypothetical protein